MLMEPLGNCPACPCIKTALSGPACEMSKTRHKHIRSIALASLRVMSISCETVQDRGNPSKTPYRKFLQNPNSKYTKSTNYGLPDAKHTPPNQLSYQILNTKGSNKFAPLRNSHSLPQEHILHSAKTLCLYIFASKAFANAYSFIFFIFLACWYLNYLVNPIKEK